MSEAGNDDPMIGIDRFAIQRVRRWLYATIAAVFSFLPADIVQFPYESYRPLLLFISNPFDWWGIGAGVFSVVIWFGVYWIFRSLRGDAIRRRIVLSLMGLGLVTFGTLVLTANEGGNLRWLIWISALVAIIEFVMLWRVKREDNSPETRMVMTRDLIWWLRTMLYAPLMALLHFIPLAGGHGVAPLALLLIKPPISPLFAVLAWAGDLFLIQSLSSGLTYKSIRHGIMGLGLWYLAILILNHEAFKLTLSQVLQVSLVPCGIAGFDLAVFARYAVPGSSTDLQPKTESSNET